MLEKRLYSRQELLELFNTDRLDAIKNKLTRQGYKYISEGRGNSYTMTIVELPRSALQRYCIDQLGFDCNVDVEKLRAFLKNVLCNEGFINLQLNEMREELEKQGVSITEKTLSKYLSQIERLDWLTTTGFDYVYYVFDSAERHNKYISREEYISMYSTYWNTVREEKGYCKAELEILQKYGNKPKKRNKQEINGIYSKQYQQLIELL